MDQSVGNERMWRNGECKERGGQYKEKGKCDNKGEQKPYIQFLRTAHLYSDKHTVFVIRIYIILIKFMDHISILLSKTRDMIG